MIDYIKNRLLTDSAHLLARAADEDRIQHNGIKGRFRELLIDTMLLPWLPPYVSCGTGTIMADGNTVRQFTQDDVIIYDQSLVPPVLASAGHAPDGIFLLNSVLARIEVKSTLTRGDIRKFIASSNDICAMNYTIWPSNATIYDHPYNLLFAYKSDAKGNNDPDFQLRRFFSEMKKQNILPISGKISTICIPSHGFWNLGRENGQIVWRRLTINTPAARVAYFVGTVSNSCFLNHAKRQGRNSSAGLEGGIGMYLDSPYITVPMPY